MQWRHGSQPENVQNSSELQRHSQKNLCDIRSVGGHHTKVHNDLNEESRLHCESHIEDIQEKEGRTAVPSGRRANIQFRDTPVFLHG